MHNHAPAPGFAPDDMTDARAMGDWKTHYPDKDARDAIRFEATYLALHLFGVPVVLLLLCWRLPQTWLDITGAHYDVFLRYCCAWLGGTLGGTVFAMKWLYHSVAKGIWNRDRRLWRIFTPHLSGGLAFAFVLIISSELLIIFKTDALKSVTLVLAFSFLIGYFSDNATAKLTEVAETLFGRAKR